MEKQAVTSNNDINIYNGPHRNNTTHEHSTLLNELDNNQKIYEENNEQKTVKTGYPSAGPLVTKTKTMAVLLGKDMEESYKNWIGWHTGIHPI